ncbi:hypothetical protein SDJN02_00156, partial [Cucurbita argyrosperma subsp. argyrosperma]
MDDDEDPWFAPDKLYHFLLCFTLTVFFAALATLTRYPFIRRHSIMIGSVLSLFAGAAKEVADELGFFKSAGASTRDAVADLVGVLIASFFLHALRFSIRRGGGKEASPNRDILMVDQARELSSSSKASCSGRQACIAILIPAPHNVPSMGAVRRKEKRRGTYSPSIGGNGGNDKHEVEANDKLKSKSLRIST